MPASQPKISAIAAMSINRVIGLHNQLPWHLPADLSHFKSLTTGHAVIMGRKTFESIGKPLPNRLNLVLTRDQNYKAPDCIVVHKLDEAIKIAANKGYSQLFIIGGAEIYSSFLPIVETLYLTIVQHDFDGDAYFPILDHNEWHELEFEQHQADADHPYEYCFITLEKQKETSIRKMLAENPIW